MKYNIAILEDEEPNARLLESYITQIEDLTLIGKFSNPVEFINSKQSSQVEILLLDIHMPIMNGMDFLKNINPNAEVIITTAYPQYAISGYEYSVVDYLLKPVEMSRFIQAINKAKDNIKIKRDTDLKNSNFRIFKVDKKLMKINLDDIVYIKSDWNYIHIFTNNSKYVVLSTMKKIEKDLFYENFIRIHKTLIINLNYFEYIEGNTVCINGNKLQIGKSYKQNFLNIISK
ncbi:MAG: LytTR family DNA-binding domain-containing protein [Marinifilaceae bacterium]|jgi:DNA-binding LytR/AlgR family response regulator|nr:LytTR family DNA-binding domain-containing protein [Marinifilaceae bacterium]